MITFSIAVSVFQFEFILCYSDAISIPKGVLHVPTEETSGQILINNNILSENYILHFSSCVVCLFQIMTGSDEIE